jgi:hypothetical protein
LVAVRKRTFLVGSPEHASIRQVRSFVLGTRRFALALLVGELIVLAHAGFSMAATGPAVECGQLTAFTAPDPVAPTAGTLRFGVLTPWEVVPTASVSVAAAAALPSILNSGPTCVSVEFDSDGKITSIDFAPEGGVTGTVTYDSGSGFYLFADRLIVPSFITDAYPGLAALFVTSYQAETSLSVTFSVDVTTGAFVGFDGHAAFCGAGGVTGDGDGAIGDAIIPAEALDPGDVTTLEGAAGGDVCAAVHATGVVMAEQEGALDIDTDVVITLVLPSASPALDDGPAGPIPTMAATSTVQTKASPDGGNMPVLLLGLAIAVAVLAATRLRPARPARLARIREDRSSDL